MKAGKLDRKITLERETEIVDRYGTAVSVWAKVAMVAAQMIQAATDEFLSAHGEDEKATVVFRIRYRPGVELTDRVSYYGRAYGIVEIKEIGRREGLELRCEASR